MEGECSGLTNTTVFQRLFGRPPRRFCCAPDDADLCRDLTNLRGARIVRFCDFTADDFRDLVLFAPRARNDRPPFRDLVWDPFNGGRLSAPFEVARLTAFPTGRPSDAAFPTRAPTTPPTTAPVGPTMLPIAAPVTAPAVCFGIGGI